MTEADFIKLWEFEKPIYEAWGRCVVDYVCNILELQVEDINTFLKIPVTPRLKDTNSLRDKAFYRPDKNYDNPYKQIEDKVGVRFVVLLTRDIETIHKVITGNTEWLVETCKHFEEDKKNDPLLFTYQSVHCIIRPKFDLIYNDKTIPSSTPCEVQIRTLLQHAHAELTHDAIYKSKKLVQPMVHRTVAKSMALIETTDGFFSDVTKLLNSGPLDDYKILDRLDGLYSSTTGFKSFPHKSSLIIWDEFEQIINENLVDEVNTILSDYPNIPQMIKERYSESILYQQSSILFIYWMLLNRKRRLLKDWPFSIDILQPMANDLAINIIDD